MDSLNNNITSANSVAIMTVEELYPNGFQLQQFASDSAISQGDMTVAETRMGVDGYMVAGFTPNIKSLTTAFEASSPSIEYINNILQAMEQNRRVYRITLVVTVPSIDKTFTYSGGVLKSGKLLPDIKKVLDPITYGWDFEKVTVD